MLPSHVFQRLGKRLREAQELGSYELVELLGRGGMGEVWRAHHRLLARSAAVKLVRPELLGAAGDVDARLMLRRFEREARATAALSSPHTIQLFDFGSTDEGAFYYVMELLVGRDLESLIKEFGPVGSDRAVFLLRQVCHSLADAHARGFVHRDIKPANIYVCRMGARLRLHQGTRLRPRQGQPPARAGRHTHDAASHDGDPRLHGPGDHPWRRGSGPPR
jgi:serine/threonine-protein kinase